MHKILYVIAIILTFNLFVTPSIAGDKSDLQTIFIETKSHFIKTRPTLTVSHNTMKEMEMLPDVGSLEGLPEPIALNESDDEVIHDYYTKVAHAYKKAADSLHESTLWAFKRNAKTQHKAKMNDFRQDRLNYAGQKIDKKHDHKSLKHTPVGTTRDNQVFQNQKYREAKGKFDVYQMKHDFYKAMAEKFS